MLAGRSELSGRFQQGREQGEPKERGAGEAQELHLSVSLNLPENEGDHEFTACCGINMLR
jgi:hypothetical protein